MQCLNEMEVCFLLTQVLNVVIPGKQVAFHKVTQKSRLFFIFWLCPLQHVTSKDTLFVCIKPAKKGKHIEDYIFGAFHGQAVRAIHFFHSHSMGQNLVLRLHLTAKEAEKCTLTEEEEIGLRTAVSS